MRWRLKLSEYDYEIKYKKGVKNVNADVLSRIVIDEQKENNHTNNEVNVLYTENESGTINIVLVPLTFLKDRL